MVLLLNLITNYTLHSYKNMALYGLLFFLFGIIILLMPEILILIIVSILFFLGLLFLYLAWKIKKSEIYSNQFRIFL
jgi:uncharacterized membrane protein